jgi:hypothetical protein
MSQDFMNTVCGQPWREITSSMPFKGFVKFSADSYILELSESEKDVLVNLSGQIIELLAERVDEAHSDPLARMVGITGHDSPPDDEVLLRLLPNAYADPVDSSEFRRYTESDLRRKKAQHSMLVRTQLMETETSSIMLDSESALAWLGAFNDIRLALGVRLNVDENSHERLELLSPDDPMHAVFAVYSWLGWLQESLVVALMEEFEAEGEES